MYKQFKFLVTLLLLAVSVGAWADETTGTISFGSATGSTNINSASVTGEDDLGNSWTVTTVGTTSFTPNSNYAQVGSSSKPATSITFTMTLPKDVKFSMFSAKFGGFNGTAGSVTLKIDETSVKTGSLKGTTDYNFVASNLTKIGKTLTVTVTGISKGVKCYNIAYTYEEISSNKANPSLSFPEQNYEASLGQTFTAPTLTTDPAGLSVTYTSSETSVATVDENTGEVSLIGAGTTTITASFAGDDDYYASSASYLLTVIDPNAPGTENNPYTVAQAISYINTLGTSTSPTEVYVSGIISQVDSYNSTYKSITYWISDDGTTTTQMEVYSGKGLNGTDFSSKDDLQVGDVVTIKGYVKKFNSTPEFDKNNVLVSFSRTKANPTITFNNGSVRVGNTLDLSTLFTSDSNGAVTYSITAGDSYATISENKLTGDAEGSVTVKASQAETTTFNAAEATATITVSPALVLSSIAVTTAPDKTTYNAGETFDSTGMVVTATYTDNSTEAVTGYTCSPDGPLTTNDTEITISYTENSVTKTTTQDITVNEVVDYATLPFEYDGNGTGTLPTGLTQSGLGIKTYSSSPKIGFDTTGDYLLLKINEIPGTLTYDIKGNSLSGTYKFTVLESANGTDYTTLKEYTSIESSTTSETLHPATTTRYIKWEYTTKASGNVALGNIALAAYVAPGNSAPVWSELPTPTIAVNAEYELDLSTYVTGTPTPTISVTTSVSNSLYEFENGLLVFQPTSAGTYEFTFTAENSEGSADATLTITAAEVATYTLATSITSGKHYVIAATTTNATKAMGGKNSTKDYYDAVDASLNGTTLSVEANSGVQEFVIYGPNADGYYSIYDPVAGGYLYASSSSDNYLSYQTENDANGLWEIDFTNETVTAKGTYTHNLLRYNSSSPRFSCYTSGQTAVKFYEKDGEATPTQTVTITSAGMATFCSENALDFTGLTDMFAYKAVVTNDQIAFTRVYKVPAYTGVLLRNPNETSASHDVPVLTGAADNVAGNAFVGTLVDIDPLATTEGNYTNYILNKGNSGLGFYQANNQKLGAGKAYLQVANSAGAKMFIGFEEEGAATGIETINNNQYSFDNSRCYNLNGQQVSGNYKGIVIVNGKKVMNK